MSAASWPWWAGSLALGGLALGYFVAVRRTFGVSGAVSRIVDAIAGPSPAEAPPTPDCTAGALTTGPAPGWTAYATFLAAIAVGALLSALTGGGLELTTQVGPTFERLVGSGGSGVAALLVGGAMVGFGTRMAGGCTSGHGLCGTGRLQAGSLVATATFFGTGIAVTFLLGALS